MDNEGRNKMIVTVEQEDGNPKQQANNKVSTLNIIPCLHNKVLNPLNGLQTLKH